MADGEIQAISGLVLTASGHSNIKDPGARSATLASNYRQREIVIRSPAKAAR
jgi:hypothetical protein